MKNWIIVAILFLLFIFITFPVKSESGKQQRELPPEFLTIEDHDVNKKGPIDWGFPEKCVQKRWPVWFYYWNRELRGPTLVYANDIPIRQEHADWSFRKFSRFEIQYPQLKVGDIFPLINNCYVYVKDTEPARGSDALRLKDDEIPQGAKLRGDTIVFLLTSDKPSILVKKHYPQAIYLGHIFTLDISLNAIRKHPQKEGEYQIQLLVFRGDASEPFQWYGVGDMLIFEIRDYGSEDEKKRQEDKQRWGVKIVNIVPPEKKPTRTIRGIECRLLGWFELEPELIPLDKNLKPMKKTESE
jgi:hypothetical protein